MSKGKSKAQQRLEQQEKIDKFVKNLAQEKREKEWRFNSKWTGTNKQKREQEKEYQKSLKKERKEEEIKLKEEAKAEEVRRGQLSEEELKREELVKEIKAELTEEFESKMIENDNQRLSESKTEPEVIWFFVIAAIILIITGNLF